MAYRRAYSIDGQRAVSSPTKTILGLTGGTTWRARIFYFAPSSSASPADNAILWYFQRYTAAGTSTAVTPTALDSAYSPAAQSSAGQNHTAEPTYTANLILWHDSINQRASPQLLLDPDAPLVTPATGSNGIGLYPVHASFTGNADATIWFDET
ncbi:MAG: hypothetical protein K2R98_08555 [Gemmataceae bacterium]|nr:hypothetical protein [Gemmataceae bacterium]